MGVYFMYMGRRNPLTDCIKFFLMIGIHVVITSFKFGDNRLRGLGLVGSKFVFSHRLCWSSLQHC